MTDFRRACLKEVKWLYGENWIPDKGQETLVFNAECGVKAFTNGNRSKDVEKNRKNCTAFINGIKRKRIGGVLFCGIPSFEAFSECNSIREKFSMAVETVELLERLKTTFNLICFLFVNKEQAVFLNFYHGPLDDYAKSIIEHELMELVNQVHCVENSKPVNTSTLIFSNSISTILPQQLEHHLTKKTNTCGSEEIWLSLTASLIGICTYNRMALAGMQNHPFLTVSQHNALHSDRITRILYGPERQLINETIELMICLNQPVELLLVSSEDKADKYAAFFAEAQVAEPPQILSFRSGISDHWMILAEQNCVIVDSVAHLTFDERMWLAERRRPTVIILDNDMQNGLQFPDGTISWHRLQSFGKSNVQLSLIPKESFSEHRFVKQAQFCLDCTYPTWKETIAAPLESGCEAICIPDALDVLSNKYLGPTNPAADGYDEKIAKDAKSKIKGFQAEEKFVTEFRRLKLGGIFLSGFNTQEFVKIMNKRVVPGFNMKQDVENWKHHFECDALFIHQKIGIYVIEVKASSGHKITRRHLKAVKQLTTAIQGLQKIYSIISGKAECDVPINGVISFPGAVISKNEIQNQLPTEQQSVAVELFETVDKILLEESDSFMQFWKSKQLEREFEFTESLNYFIAALIAYRSAVFVSPASNALEIYRIIDQQDFMRTKPAVSNKESFPKPIYTSTIDFKKELGMVPQFFLNKQQLLAVECPESRVLIYGPPGTGKTICILLRALRVASLKKCGRVIVVTMNGKYLIAKFEQFFHENRCNIKRQVIVIEANDGLLIEEDDDIFFDEASADLLKKFSILRNRSSKEMIGQTTVVITGQYDPRAAGDLHLLEREYRNFFLINLKTVIRGTRTIIERWAREFKTNFVCFGHSVYGAPIERTNRLLGVNQTLFGLRQKVEELLTHLPLNEKQILGKEGNLIDYQFAHRHVAILTESKRNVNEALLLIKTYLASEGLPCGSIEEQIYNSSLIAVDRALSAASYEWPAVIIIAESENFALDDDVSGRLLAGRPSTDFDIFMPKRSDKTTQRELLVGLTRGIAKLIIVEGVKYDVDASYIWSKSKPALTHQPLATGGNEKLESISFNDQELKIFVAKHEISSNKRINFLKLSTAAEDGLLGKNLIQNPSGEQGLIGWIFLENSGNIWKVESPPEGCGNTTEFPTAFVTSHKLCIKRQTVDLTKIGFCAEFLAKARPIIVVSEWYTSRSDCPSEYNFKTWLAVADEGGNNNEYDVRQQSFKISAGESWTQVKHIYENYPLSTCAVVLQSGGRDGKFWAGHFGVKTARASVVVLSGENIEINADKKEHIRADSVSSKAIVSEQ